MMLSAERLREILSYDPETGIFMRVGGKRNLAISLIGKAAGSFNGLGYIQIKLDGHMYLAHRLAWLFMTGVWPTNQIDHANGVKDDNRFVNLREAEPFENGRNRGISKRNTSGFKGVSWNKVRKAWFVTIKFDGKPQFLGYFTDIESASRAYQNAALKNHLEFAHLDL